MTVVSSRQTVKQEYRDELLSEKKDGRRENFRMFTVPIVFVVPSPSQQRPPCHVEEETPLFQTYMRVGMLAPYRLNKGRIGRESHGAVPEGMRPTQNGA